MTNELIRALADGLELRLPAFNTQTAVDFAVVSDRGTMIFLADWWGRWPDGFGTSIHYISAPPTFIGNNTWSFVADESPLLAPFTDEGVREDYALARQRADLRLGDYYNAIRAASQTYAEFDFAPWLKFALSRPRDLLDQLVADETRERPVGKILLLDGNGAVVDTLVIDENGLACTASDSTESLIAWYAERWMEFTADDRPPLAEYVAWMSEQSVYGPYALTGAGVFSASGSVHQIALTLASGNI